MDFACAWPARLGGGNTSEILSQMSGCHELQLHDVIFARAVVRRAGWRTLFVTQRTSTRCKRRRSVHTSTECEKRLLVTHNIWFLIFLFLWVLVFSFFLVTVCSLLWYVVVYPHRIWVQPRRCRGTVLVFNRVLIDPDGVSYFSSLTNPIPRLLQHHIRRDGQRITFSGRSIKDDLNTGAGRRRTTQASDDISKIGSGVCQIR